MTIASPPSSPRLVPVDAAAYAASASHARDPEAQGRADDSFATVVPSAVRMARESEGPEVLAPMTAPAPRAAMQGLQTQVAGLQCSFQRLEQSLSALTAEVAALRSVRCATLREEKVNFYIDGSDKALRATTQKMADKGWNYVTSDLVEHANVFKRGMRNVSFTRSVPVDKKS